DANAAVTGVMAAAQAAPVVPPPPVEEPPTAEPKPLSEMSADELSERLAYIRQQLRSGGSTAVIGRALREVRDEIARRSAEP
ncbi:hypothetical protein, partial [Streptococcus pseudopneumoniae]|uniref:hypothetical protein n=1 Tax=Streptococcus pseudopneumoniae TaxID=257758 RepID=UPI0019D4F3AB